MDIYTRFNRNRIEDRRIDTLIGLCKGLAADRKIDQSEAECLMIWLVQNRDGGNPIILNLLKKVHNMLYDRVLDSEESAELLSILRSFSGDKSEIGELAKTSNLPIDNPLPKIKFAGRTFLFTGTCVYGNRQECKEAIKKLGGINLPRVTMKLNYLILGAYVNDSWAHETFGRKIEKAIKYKDQGIDLAIVTEQHWVDQAGL